MSRNIKKFKPLTYIIVLLLTAELMLITFFLLNDGEDRSNVDKKISENDKIVVEVEQLLESLTLEEKIYQMFFVKPETIINIEQVTTAGEETQNALEAYPVGGIIYFAENIKTPEQTQALIENTQMYSTIPLFIGVDEEGGDISRIGNNPNMGTTNVGNMRLIGENGIPQKAYEAGNIIGNDLKNLGFNVDFAPVADVLIDDKNSEIGDRAFGRDPELVAIMVGEFVSGLESTGVSSVIKHFPGHGSTKTNSHMGYSESIRTLEELRNNEFVPFKEGINAGADFVLISHMTLVNATNEKVPASLSKEVVNGWLKCELNYKGIVITDALRMGAISQNYSSGEAAIMAIKAGNDMLLMPEDVHSAFTAVYNEVKTGNIDETQINDSVRKILLLKKEKGLF